MPTRKRVARERQLAAMKRETARDLRMQARDLLSRPIEDRMDFLLQPVTLPDGRIGWAL